VLRPDIRLRWRDPGPCLDPPLVKAAEPVTLPSVDSRGRDRRCPELFHWGRSAGASDLPRRAPQVFQALVRLPSLRRRAR
jgi:hypothetical protein